ncbi:type II toxin-antitoxin system RelE/ParE family toxin [Massilia glaciei]|uniref:Type II toxin-antitoxin system RelE/ParE family toxin n=1 Tax=Massilia glaciei TaxID=1524097 RepID=A0A2U2HJE8_9BURK|nr:type II toxin-antitoxin system RelE/ParE family toxin [Massilia glaciei]PWF46832.1 type II toxin-antitoxin system RelE/ParE family toxin [Massilia glaciei]
MTVKWTKTALANLISIVEFIERDNPERAKSFAMEIQSKTNRLTEFPSIGRPGRVTGTRELVIHPNYIISYRVRGDVVEILRVQHVARRWPKRL